MPEPPKEEETVAEHRLELNKDEFSLFAQEDYMRVDSLCKGILLNFYEHLLAEGIAPEEATSLANGADLFVRDFLVDCKSYNLFDERPGIVKQFAGNWYIVNTLEPDIKELNRYLLGIRAFYGYLCEQKLITESYLAKLEKECSMESYYEGRIESFWKIEGDGFTDWERGCTLKDPLATPARA
jgi:hypothetical protein